MEKSKQICPLDKVRNAITDGGLALDIIETSDTIRTVDDASKAVGAPPEKILKSIMMIADGRPTMALMSGCNRVDSAKVKSALGAKKVRMADPDFVFEFSGFKVGGVPPVGFPDRIPTVLDRDLFLYDVVYAAAGTEHAFFPITPDDLKRLTDGVIAEIKKQ